MRFRKVGVVIAITSLLAGCGSDLNAARDELASTKESLEKTKAENESLKKEIEELKFGPVKLLKEANKYFSAGDIIKLNKTKDILTTKHPGSEEEKQVIALSKKLQDQIDDQKAKDKAEADKLAAAEKKKSEAALAFMRKKTDEVTGITFYEDKSSPQYINDNGFNLFFSTNEGSDIPVLYARFQYTGDNWLFVQSYTIRADDKTFTINPSYSEVNRDNHVGGVWEYYNTLVNGEVLEIVEAIIKSKKAVIRSQGDERHQDRTVTAQEKKALQNVLDAFKVMGGTDAQFKL